MLGVVLLLVIGGGYALWHAHQSDTKTSGLKVIATKPGTVTAACKVFTLDDAKKVLGSSAISTPATPSTSTSAMDVSNCVYSNGSSDSNSIQTASILLRTPKNDTGKNANISQFQSQKPANVQTVNGYGQAAFWSSQYGQLNVLKNNSWVILSIGPIDTSAHTLSQTEQLASVVVPKI